MARQSGGRKARRALRSAPLADALKPVRPGESGGQFRPLSDAAVKSICDNVFRILEEVGFSEATPHCLEACASVGAIVGADGRLKMPRSVVEKTLETARRDLTLTGRNPNTICPSAAARCISPQLARR